MKTTSLLNRKRRDRNRQQRLNQRSRSRLLRFESMEARLLLAADFGLSAGTLTLDNFTQADSESLAVSEDGNSYRFALSEGTWTTQDSPQSGIALTSGDQVLEIEKSLLSGGTIGEILVSDTAGIDFDVTFNNINLQPLQGAFALLDVGHVGQAGGSIVQFGHFDVTAASVTLAESGNDFGSVRVTATAGGVTLFDAGDIVLGTPGLADTASVPGGDYMVTALGTIIVSADHSIDSAGSAAVSLTAGRNISLATGSSITTVDGGITLQANQQATPTAGDFIGIDVNGAAITTTGSGNVELTGRGGDDALTGNHYGIRMQNSATIQSTATGATAGTITIDGTGGAGTSDNHGVWIVNSGSQVTSLDGDIQISGTAGAGNSVGIDLRDQDHILATGEADVTLIADSMDILANNAINAGANTVTLKTFTTSGAIGIDIGGDNTAGMLGLNNAELNRITAGLIVIGDDETPNTITLSDDIQHAGDAGFRVTTARNIVLPGGTSWTSEHGNLFFSANQQATPTSGNFVGIDVNGATIASSGTGDISLVGRGGDSSSGNYGIHLGNGTTVQSTATGADAAAITLDGTGGTGTHNNHGVRIESSGTQVTSVDGDILITGRGGDGSSSTNLGVWVRYAAVISSTGAGADAATVTLDGTGGNSTFNNFGVRIENFGTQVTSVEGDILITGRGDGSGGGNHGVWVLSAAVVSSTGTGTDAATITLDGTGGNSTFNNFGVRIENSGTQVTSVDGDILITGAAGAGTSGGIELWTANGILATATAAVTLIADSMNIDAANGVVAGSGTVTLRQQANGRAIDLGTKTPGTLGLTNAELNRITAGMLVIGDEDTGTVTVSEAMQHTGDADVSVVTGRNIVLLSGSSITTVDGDLTLSANMQTTPTSGNHIGIEIDNANISSMSGSIRVQGRGGDELGHNYGVYIHGGAAVGTGTTGLVTVEGVGGGGIDTHNNRGLYISGADTRITSGGGSVHVAGTGGGAGSSGVNHGLIVADSAQITAGGVGLVTVVGTGGNNTGSDGNSNFGVNVFNAQITSSGGPVSVTGTGGGAGTSANNYGVLVSSAGEITAAGAGSVTVNGSGGSTEGGGWSNIGVSVEGTHSRITSGGGHVAVYGTGGGAEASSNNYGVWVSNGAITAAGVGSVTVDGAGGNTTGSGSSNHGVVQSQNSRISSGGGDVSISGNGGGSGTGSNNYGVYVAAASVLSAEANGNVSVTGIGGHAGGSSNHGVYVVGTNSRITSSSGHVAVTGTGGGADASGTNYGVSVSFAAEITAGETGSVTVAGFGGNTAGTGGFFNLGVVVTRSNARITSSGGDVMVTGTGGGAGTSHNNHGVFLPLASEITAGGTGSVTVVGAGGNTTGTAGNSNTGINVQGTSSRITSSGGDVSVTGTGGGAGTSGSNGGVIVQHGGEITGRGTASVTVEGVGGNTTGSNNDGVLIVRTGSLVGADAGGVRIIGTAGSGTDALGFNLIVAGTVKTTGTGDVSITADSMNIGSDTSINAGTNAVSLAPRTLGMAIDLGGADAPATLGLTDAELDRITTGSLTIGDESTGAITLTSAIQHAGDANLNIVTGRNIALLSGSNITTVDGDLMLSANMQHPATGGNHIGIEIDNATIGSTSGAITLTGRGGDGPGQQYGVSIHSGATVGAGTNGAVTIIGKGGNTTGDEGNANQGVRVVNAMIGSGGGDIAVTGTGGGSGTSANNYGVFLVSGGEIMAEGAGSVTVVGFGGNTSGTGGSQNHGLLVQSASSRIKSGGGDVWVTGAGGGAESSSNNFGVSVFSGGAIAAGGIGNVTVEGSGSIGVSVFSANSLITSAGGQVSVSGDGSGVGVRVQQAGQITAEGAGNVTVQGSGGSGGGSSAHGVSVNGSGSQIIAGDGGVNVIGTAGGESGAHGFIVRDSGELNTTGTGTISITADRIHLGSSVNAGANAVTLVPETSGTTIGLGSADASGRLGLTDDELDRVTAGVLRIGSENAGAISITQAINPAGTDILHLFTGGTVDAGDTGAIAVEQLAVSSVGSVSLKNWTLGNSVQLLAAATTGPGSGIHFENDGALAIGTVDGLSGISVNGGGIAIITHSPLTINQGVVDVGGGNITLTATNDGGDDDHLTINASVQASGGSGNVELNAGTNLILGGGTTVSATGSGTISATATQTTELSTQATLTTEGGEITLQTQEVVVSGTDSNDEISLQPSGDDGGVELTINGVSLVFTPIADGEQIGVETVTSDGSPNTAPLVDAGANRSVEEGERVHFSGSFTDADAGDTHTIVWDFGDGSGAVVGTLTPEHSYADNGTYTVSLAVTDRGGLRSMDTLTVTVTNVPPTATIFNDGPVTYGQSITVGFIDPFDPSPVDTAAGFRYSFGLAISDLANTYLDADGSSLWSSELAAGTYTVYGRIFDRDNGYNQYDTAVIVEKAMLTVTADDQNKIYGEADPALTYRITEGSLAFTDAFFGDLARAAGEDVGSYAIEQGSLGLSDNYDLSFVKGELKITHAILSGDATTQDALNLAKQGLFQITVANIEGFVNGENSDVFLTAATFWITIEGTKYEFEPTSVEKLSDSGISISYKLKNSALQEDLAEALESATSGATALAAGFSMASTNYSLSDDDLTRLFSTVK